VSRDFYIVLGISRGADLKRIKEAYRDVVKKVHPDATRSPESAEQFREIKEAYETLSDEARRREYDKELERQGSRLTISDAADTIERWRSPFDEMERLFSSSADDFFEGFLPRFFDRQRGGITEKDLYYEAVLSPAEAANGGLFPITVPVLEPCPRCRKTGFWEDFFCPLCSGYGRVKSERAFSVSIPPRVTHGTRMRLSLEDIGLRDVHLTIIVLIDPRLEEDTWPFS